MGIISSFEKNSQIGFDIFEGTNDPIDLISINAQGSSVPAKFIDNESVSLIIIKFLGFPVREEIKSKLFAKRICSFFIFVLVEILNKGTFIINKTKSIITNKKQR